MSETTYYQRNRDIMLNIAKNYYENNKELLRERAKNKYRSLSEEEKDIKKQYQKGFNINHVIIKVICLILDFYFFGVSNLNVFNKLLFDITIKLNRNIIFF